MAVGFPSLQYLSYQVATPVYEGPLDLLLRLIERAELDITKVSLAQVTDQFLEHMRNLTELAADEVSAFLVIAARLLQIKSEALLPRPPVREPGEEDPGEALARQLIVYKRFREIAELLTQRELLGLRAYLRLAPPPKATGVVDLSGVGIRDLQSAAQEILLQVDTRPFLQTVVSLPRITVREKVLLIARALRERGSVKFRSLLVGKHSRLEVVVSFLAMLELIKRYLVLAHQEQIFGEIEIEATQILDENDEFELEFGE